MCFRWIEDLKVHEDFVWYYELPDKICHRGCSVRKAVLRNFAKFTGKHLCQSLYFNIVEGLTPFLQNISGRLLLDIKSDTIVTAIKDYLIRMQLSLNDLRTQAYDGASDKFGKNTGVSVQIAAQKPKVLSTHCQGHSLNFGIKAATTKSKQMKGVMGIVTEITWLVKYLSFCYDSLYGWRVLYLWRVLQIFQKKIRSPEDHRPKYFMAQ